MRRTVWLTTAVVLALVAACAAAILAVSTKPAEAAFPGRNGDIVFTSREPPDCGTLAAIVRVRPDGTGLTPLTCDPVLQDFAQYPAWSADGKRIVFQLDADDSDDMGRDLWVMGANGGNRVNITNTPNVDEWHPAWFPSGKKIAYEGRRYIFLPEGGVEIKGGLKVATLGEDGKVDKTSLLTSDGAKPAISPNGKRLAFYSTRDGDAEIYVMRTDAPEGPNNRPVKLTDNATYSDRQPDWSPDGSRIVCASVRGDNWEDIFVMRADGSRKKRLTRNPARDQYPAFSPDGKYIVFTSDRTGDQEIWKMKADGTRPTKLTNNGDNLQPDWQPRP
jgi:Tol biopolymer transport system component